MKKKKTADIFADPSGETWNQKEKSKKRMCNKKQENPAENEIFHFRSELQLLNWLLERCPELRPGAEPK